jgi:hypothetical protein
MKKIKILFLLAIFLMFFGSCSKSDYDLVQSTFIPDQENIGLPEYSEFGYNTFGAYFGRKIFVSNNTDVPLKVIIRHDTLNLQFTGSFQNNTDYSSTKAILNFAFVGIVPASYQNLEVLENQTFDLTDDNCIVSFKNEDEEVFQIIEGYFEVKKLQHLVIDEEYDKSIISGKFQFKTLIDGDPSTISKGRFDFTVGDENFFVFN